MTKLFVSNLPINYTIRDIKQIFNAFGPLRSIKPYITAKKEEGQIQSAFIEYINADDATMAIKKLQNKKFYSRYLVMQRAFERYNKVYVGNLDEKITNENLLEYFEEFGKVSTIQKEKENDYAFVVFEDAKVAEMIVNNHGNKKIMGNCQPVAIKRAESKVESQKRQIPHNRTICAQNLSENITSQILTAFFFDCGSVEKVQISNRRAFVVFKEELGALKAIKYKNKKELNGKRISIGIYTGNKRYK